MRGGDRFETVDIGIAGNQCPVGGNGAAAVVTIVLAADLLSMLESPAVSSCSSRACSMCRARQPDQQLHRLDMAGAGIADAASDSASSQAAPPSPRGP